MTSRQSFPTMMAGVIGNVVEWYDFALYGYLATVLAHLFFPSQDPLSALLQTYGVFAAGFLMRPLGAVLFGFIGDRLGRDKALILSVAAMGLPTILLGLLPTYESWGATATALLVAIRLVQGLSVGGEFSSSVTYVVETAPAGGRGLAGSWANVGSVAGMLLGSAMAAAFTASLSTEALHQWGWRVPFLLGGVLAVLSLYLRRSLPDTEAFREHCRCHENDSPLHEALTRNLRETLLAIVFASGYGVFFYLPLVYLPTYVNQVAGVPLGDALEINTFATALMLLLIPLAGFLSDRFIRRKHLLILVFATMALAALPALAALAGGGTGTLLAVQAGFVLLIAGALGSAPAFFVELFPTEDRLTGYSLAFNLGLGLVGGTAPMMATWLIELTGSPLAPAVYLAALCLVAGAALLATRDRSRETLL